MIASTCLVACRLLLLAALPSTGNAQQAKVLRYAFPIAETGFDPVQVTDLYSRIVTHHIFDSLYSYDHLARPFKIKPNTAAAMPEVSDDFRVWTIKLRPGIYFQDDPAFKGQRRELTAQDYVYSFKRYFDPRWKSPNYARSSEPKESSAWRRCATIALKSKKPFDYDREGRWHARARQIYVSVQVGRTTAALSASACAGRLVRRSSRVKWSRPTATRFMRNPVGTGPFRLAEWRRSSRIVLESNPTYREHVLRRRAQRGRRGRPGVAAALSRPALADDRSSRDFDHRRTAAAVAVVPESGSRT